MKIEPVFRGRIEDREIFLDFEGDRTTVNVRYDGKWHEIFTNVTYEDLKKVIESLTKFTVEIDNYKLIFLDSVESFKGEK